MMLCGIAAASLMLPACATVTRGTKETFNIVTTPTAAEVALSTGQNCVSPCKLKLKRKHAFTVTAKKPGYRDATASVRSVVKGGGVTAGAGNILIGGVIGGIVDGSNGAMKDLTPNPLNLTLEPIPAVVEAPVAVEAATAEASAVEATPATETAPAAPATEPAPSASPSSGE